MEYQVEAQQPDIENKQYIRKNALAKDRST
jgi:hypothetical protein